MELKVFQLMEFMNNRLSNIENNIAKIDEKLEMAVALQRNHLIRVKNGEHLDDSMILMGQPYNDLSPEKAHSIYQNENIDFLILDVSAISKKSIEGSILIPLEDLPRRYAEIQSKTTPILVISEKGLRSIMACEILVRKGHFNVNNISGGHLFWPTKNLKIVKEAV